jgi:hypothetical protein
MEKHPEVGVVGGAIEVINARGKSLVTYRHPIKDREIKSALLDRGSVLCHPTVLMRKDVLVSVGGYRKIVVDAEDYDLWLRIGDRFQLANLETVVLKYRRHADQVSVRSYRQQALSSVVARTAALLRRDGKPDPLDSVGAITPALLAGFGVSEAAQEIAVARGYLGCIRRMADAGEYVDALKLIELFCPSDWKHAEKRVMADSRLLAARIYWHQRRFAKSTLSAGRALVTRPIMLGRPLMPLMRWLRLVGTH